MSAETGIAAINDYSTAATPSAAIALLLAILPNIDSPGTSGAQAGGGFLDEISPVAVVQLRVELAAIQAGGAGGVGVVAYNQHTVTAGEASANLVDIVTGLADLTLTKCAATIRRAGTDVTVDAVLSEPVAGTLRIADGSTYNTTAGDIVTWVAKL